MDMTTALSASTIVAGALAFGFGVAFGDAKRSLRSAEWKLANRLSPNPELERRNAELENRLASRDQAIRDLNAKLVPLQEADAKMRAHRRIAGKKGNAVSQVRKAERRAAAAKQTLAALEAIPMRSRAKVVAPVKASRTRAKNAAGVAA